MRKFLLATAIVVVSAVPASAQASCNTRCLNHKVAKLTNKINQLTGRVNQLTTTVGTRMPPSARC
jgi:hypothetical protein